MTDPFNEYRDQRKKRKKHSRSGPLSGMTKIVPGLARRVDDSLDRLFGKRPRKPGSHSV